MLKCIFIPYDKRKSRCLNIYENLFEKGGVLNREKNVKLCNVEIYEKVLKPVDETVKKPF